MGIEQFLQEVDADYEGQDEEASLTLPSNNRVGPELRWGELKQVVADEDAERRLPFRDTEDKRRPTVKQPKERGDRPAFFIGDDTPEDRIFQHHAGVPSCMWTGNSSRLLDWAVSIPEETRAAAWCITEVKVTREGKLRELRSVGTQPPFANARHHEHSPRAPKFYTYFSFLPPPPPPPPRRLSVLHLQDDRLSLPLSLIYCQSADDANVSRASTSAPSRQTTPPSSSNRCQRHGIGRAAKLPVDRLGAHRAHLLSVSLSPDPNWACPNPAD
ncbi:hypothetical protein CSAL01_09728 [Colletotrichum salicis]|uniref:Uncharacterized protein n=1 Tax=Colletotrichum salicis TaxID=1209931 RepID=A0A135U485_9PEZI|nr:hypothetical protein CSAL01_09728 [Colletotrichum salicis]